MTHKFLPPASVNYSKPFRIVGGDSKGNIYEHSYNAQDEIVLTNLTTGEKHKWYNFGDVVKANIEKGAWKVIDETPEMPLGEFFKFETKNGTCVCTYLKQASGNPVISWAGTSTRRYTEKDCRANIESGEWTVLPSTSTTEQSSENAFKALEDVVRNHKQLNILDNSVDSLLDTIKAFTASGKFHVSLSEGVYTVYGRDDMYCAKSDKQLIEVMKALEILEGCV